MKPKLLDQFLIKLNIESIEELIKKGADVNEIDSSGCSPLHYIHNKSIIKLLIDHGANVNIRDNRGRTPLFYYKSTETFELLIRHGADVKICDINGNTALHNDTDISTAQLLIAQGIDVNTRNVHNETPLFYAESVEFAELLVTQGADINARDNNGKNALDYSPKKLVKLFIYHGIVPSSVNIYQDYRDLFSEEQQKAFDTFQLITSNDEDFYQMCLSYQNSVMHHAKINIQELDIL